MSELVDLATIAEAVGVGYRTAREKWATSPDWPPHYDRAGRGGAKRWRVADLPTAFVRRGRKIDVRAAVERLLAVQAAKSLDRIASAQAGGAIKYPATSQFAPGGELIPAGRCPLPADTSPAATGAGGLTGGGGAGCALVSRDVGSRRRDGTGGRAGDGLPSAGKGQLTLGAGSIPATPAASAADAPARSDETRLIEAARRKMIIAPILRGEIKGRAAIEAHAKSHGTTAATIYRWVKAFKQGGDHALVDKPRADRGQARVVMSETWEKFARGAMLPEEKMLEIAAEMARVVRGLWAQGTRVGWRQVAQLAEVELVRLTMQATGCAEEVARRVCKLSRRWVEGERRYSLIALKDRDAKGFYDKTPAVVRTRAALKPGDCVFGDVSPADIPVLRPDGEIAWARLIAWMDAATNFLHVTGHLPGKGAGVRREHVALSFTALCQSAPFGMPKRLYLDNGSEFSWAGMLDAWMELSRLTAGTFGGTWDSFMAAEHFGIVTRSIPFKPRAKLIEGTFGNLLRFMGWHPAFAGSDRMRKKVATLGKGVQPIPVEDLKGFIAQAVAAYNATPQSGHLNGKSPAEKMAEFLADGFTPYHAPAEVLQFAFGETHECRVRMGQVRVGGWTYYDKALIAFDGEKVTVRWPRHAPDAAYVFHKNYFIAAAAPMPVFAWGDPEGAKYAAKLAAEAREVVEVMRGQVAWLDPRDLMGEFARLARVDRVVDEAASRARRIELTPEAQAMADARRAAIEQSLAKAAPRNHDLVAHRYGVVDEEADAVRLWLESDDEEKSA